MVRGHPTVVGVFFAPILFGPDGASITFFVHSLVDVGFTAHHASNLVSTAATYV